MARGKRGFAGWRQTKLGGIGTSVIVSVIKIKFKKKVLTGTRTHDVNQYFSNSNAHTNHILRSLLNTDSDPISLGCGH